MCFFVLLLGSCFLFPASLSFVAGGEVKGLEKKEEKKKIAWDGLQPAVESGEIDAIIAGMTADKKREKGLDFTTPYYQSEVCLWTFVKD